MTAQQLGQTHLSGQVKRRAASLGGELEAEGGLANAGRTMDEVRTILERAAQLLIQLAQPGNGAAGDPVHQRLVGGLGFGFQIANQVSQTTQARCWRSGAHGQTSPGRLPI
jgi:hypothetical protein